MILGLTFVVYSDPLT